MGQIVVGRRIRPIRLAFMIQRGNPDDLMKVIRLNTVLWGGRYNAIIPTFRRTPRAWRDAPPSDALIRAYVDTFEPDFVVRGSGVDPVKHGIDPSHVLDLDAVTSKEKIGSCGLTVTSVYRWQYQKELRFVQKAAATLVSPRVSERSLRMVVGASMGEFPGGDLVSFAENYAAVGGTETVVTTSNFLDILRGNTTPLSLGSTGLEVRRRPLPNRAIFLMKATSTDDVIDYWNLRALGWRILPVPTEWSQDLAGPIRDVIDQYCRPSPGQHEFFTRAIFLAGRSVRPESLTEFRALVNSDPSTVVMRFGLPRVWSAELREADRTARVEISAGDDEVEVALQEDRLSFSTAAPDFGERWPTGYAQYVNVMELRSHNTPEMAEIIPKGIRRPEKFLSHLMPANRLRVSSEGIVVLAHWRSEPVSLRVPSGSAVFERWMSTKGRLELSSPGRIADRLIQIIGGPEAVRLVGRVELIKLLSAATRSASRDIAAAELRAELLKMHGNETAVVDRVVARLLRRKVLRLGMRLSCPRCSQANWFSLKELREDLECQRCLEAFAFPLSDPPKQPCWAYRPLGPFSVENHAQGAYVVAASIRAFRQVGYWSRTTWIPSFTLTLRDRTKLEADFGLFWEARGPEQREPQLILGECKTFDRFKPVDVRRMRQLSKEIPGAVIVFATFNESLTPREKRLLAPLARSGRKNWRRPVMILTSRELTGSERPFESWGDGTARERDLYDKLSLPVSLRRLADATQQLYLDLEPDANWPHHEAP